jgi:site-specific DNA recombinase
MASVHTSKGAGRYRYYATSGQTHPSVPAVRIAQGVLDELVKDQGAPLLAPTWRPEADLADRVRQSLLKVVLGEDEVVLELQADAVSVGLDARLKRMDDRVRLTVPIQLKKRQGAILVSVEGAAPKGSGVDRALVRAVCLAKTWSTRLADGEVSSVKALAQREGFCEHYAAKLLPLAWLAPDLVQTILDGEQPKSISLQALTSNPLPMSWPEQRRYFRAL